MDHNTGEMRRRALMMMMIGAPAISAGACVGAITAVMPWVLAMTLKAIWVGRETLLPFAQQ